MVFKLFSDVYLTVSSPNPVSVTPEIMNVLGLIPARGGSKGIPHKNIVPVAGKPLLAYTCESARQSQLLTRTLLNTDDPQIAAVAQDYGIETPFLRPAELARDDTPILPVIRHTLDWLAENKNFVPEAVVLLQPTSPLRQAAHIDAAIDLLFEQNADTVVSVIEVPHQFNPVSLMRLDENRQLQPYIAGPMILRRQEKPRVFARNGPAVLAIRRETILQDQLYGEKVLPLLMEPAASLDVDGPDDIALAEFWLARRTQEGA